MKRFRLGYGCVVWVFLAAFVSPRDSCCQEEGEPLNPVQRIEKLEGQVQELQGQLEALKSAEMVDQEEEGVPVAGFDPTKQRPFLQSEDGNFRVELGGRIQVRYTYQGRDVNRGDRDGSDLSFAELERARLRTEGHMFTPNLRFRLEWDGHTDDEELGLTDAYLQYRWNCPEEKYQMAFGGGQWKPYFGRQEKQSSAQQLLVDRSLANEYFNIDRNAGLWIEGRKEYGEEAIFNALGYELAVTNGIDTVNKSPGSGEVDNIPAFIAHIDVDVMGNLGKYALSGGDLRRSEKPGLTVGASFVSDQNNNSGVGTNQRFRVYQMAYDFVYKYQGFSLNGEYFGRWLQLRSTAGSTPPTSGADYTHGGYLEAGMMIPEQFESLDGLQVVSRVSAVWNREGPTHGNAVEAGGGLNYFFYGHKLKLSTDILFIDVPPDLLPQTERLTGHDPIADVSDFEDFDSSSANLGEFQGVMLRLQAQLYF